MRRSLVVSVIVLLGIVILIFGVLSQSGNLKWLVLALPIAFLAFYFLRAGATWPMKLFVAGLFGPVIYSSTSGLW